MARMNLPTSWIRWLDSEGTEHPGGGVSWADKTAALEEANHGMWRLRPAGRPSTIMAVRKIV
jgi:hypothetical protein